MLQGRKKGKKHVFIALHKLSSGGQSVLPAVPALLVVHNMILGETEGETWLLEMTRF